MVKFHSFLFTAIIPLFSFLAYPQINRIYLITFTHLDIGFNWPRDEVGIGYKHCIDRAIELCERYPDFKWTIETSWQLEEWLKRTRDEKTVNKLKELIKQGRIYLCAAPATFHSGVISGEEACRLFYPTYKLCKKLGIDMPKVVIQNDVPGYTIAYPQIMKESGIPYFLTGINAFIGKGADIARKDIPFWWEGDGGAKVLTWISPSYIEAMDWGLSHFDAGKLSEQEQKMKNQLERLSSEGYRHDAVIVLASILDNLDSAGASAVLNCAKHWNSQGKKPEVILANPEEFFYHIENSIKAEDLPTLRGDWCGLWEIVRSSLGFGNMLSRWAKEYLPVAETLASVFQIKYSAPYPWEDLEAGWRALWEYDEHTAGGGVAQDYGATKEQVKQGEWESLFTAERVYASASNILDFYLRIMPVSSQRPIIFNPLPWEREEVVLLSLPAELQGSKLEIKDAQTGGNLLYDALDNEHIVLKMILPPFGYKYLEIKKLDEPLPLLEQKDELWIENEFFKIEVSQDGKIMSILEKTTDRELIGKDAHYLFNEILRGKTSETYIGDVKRVSPDELIKGKARCEKGALMERIIIERNDCPLSQTEIRLFRGIKRVEIRNTLDLKITRFAAGDSYLLTFPLNIDKEKMEVRVDGPLQGRKVPDDYLPPKKISSLPANRWIEIREENGYGIIISSRQAFLWLVGSPRWAPHEINRNPVLFPILINIGRAEDLPYSFMRSPYPMPDKFVFEFAFTTSSTYDPVLNERFASCFCLPPLFNFRPLPGYPAYKAELAESFIEVKPDNVRLLTVKRAEFGEDNEFVIRLVEKAGKPTIATLKLPGKIMDAQLCDLLEREKSEKALSLEPLKISIEPYGIVTVKVRVQH